MFISSARPGPNTGRSPLDRYPAFALVDWDDTLVATNTLYRQANQANAHDIWQALGQPGAVGEEQIRSMADELDLAKVRAQGLSHSRYPAAWVETYERLASGCGCRVEADVAARLRQRAEAVAWADQEWLAGAQVALRSLRAAGVEITIWTAGEVAVQRHKLERACLAGQPVWRWVDRVVVVPDKDERVLQEALGPRLRRRPERCFVMGNSPRADVRPALALGITAVWVQSDSWSYDRHPLNGDERGLHVLASLDQFPAWLASWLRPTTQVS